MFKQAFIELVTVEKIALKMQYVRILVKNLIWRKNTLDVQTSIPYVEQISTEVTMQTRCLWLMTVFSHQWNDKEI